MRIFLVMTLIIALLPNWLYAKEDYYGRFLKEYKAKNHSLALEYIEKAYQDNPRQDYIIYWYGLQLYQNKKYEKAALLFSQLPENYYPMNASWYWGSSLLEAGQTEQAIVVLKNALNKKESQDDTKQNVYFLLFKTLVQENRFTEIVELQAGFIKYFQGSKDNYVHWLKYSMGLVYLEQAILSLEQDSQIFDNYLNKAIELTQEGLGQYQAYLNSADIKRLITAKQYYEAPDSKNTPYIFKIKVYIFRNLDAVFESLDGKKKQGKGFFEQAQLPKYKGALKLFSMLVYQLSRGKIRIENEVQVLDATVKEVKSILWSSGQTGQKVEVLQPVFETIEGYPAADIFQSKNQQDGFIFLYPMDKKLIEQRAHGFSGPSYPMLVANTLDMSARRMGITLALDNSSIYRTGVVLVHEFFHNVEAAYEYGITHVYYDQFKALWPAWYKGGGELSYYEAYFRNIVDPKGYSQLYYKNNLDSVNEKDLERAVSYRDKYEAKRLKQSKEWMGKAWEWYNAGKKESAKASFLKAYELFPYAPRVNEMLGYLFYLDKDYKTALFHYLKEEETSSSPQNFYQMIAYLYEITNDLKQSGHYYAKLWEATPEFAKNLYLLGRNYYLRKDYKNALNYFEQYLAMKKENDELIAPVLEMSAYILCYQEKNLPKASLLVEKYIVLVNEPKAKGKLLFYAAYAYGESGNKAKAREYLALCRKLNYNENMDYYEKRYRE